MRFLELSNVLKYRLDSTTMKSFESLMNFNYWVVDNFAWQNHSSILYLISIKPNRLIIENLYLIKKKKYLTKTFALEFDPYFNCMQP